MFDFLKIKNIPEQDMESVSGFFIHPDAKFFISRKENLISYQDKTYNLEPGDLIRTESNLYLKSSYFGKIFGLDCVFNFRSLTVTVNSQLELPLIREMRLEEMRKNLTRLKGEVIADTTIGRTYPLFQMGTADWSVTAAEEINGKSDARFTLGLGAIIAGGEATASLYYNSLEPITEKQQQYLWRYVNNDFKPVKQVMLGKIATQATSTLYDPVIGVQFTNTPTTYRRSFGTYMLSDRTEPGWIVELYVNNVLVDYVKADASGFFKFEVPLVYGNSIVHLKFFGPWGEERSREQNINIPFNFLPANTFEYKVSAGIVEDSLFSKFSRASLNYGVSRRLTVGTGFEYLSSVSSGPTMPYISASWSVLNNLLLSGEYTYGVRTKGTLTYRLPSNLQFNINYTLYDKDQKAINYNYLEERKAEVSMPLRIGKFSSYQRLSVYQIVLPTFSYTTGEWLFSGSLFGVNTNLTTFALFTEESNPSVYTNLSLAFSLPGNLIIRPQTQYGFSDSKFQTVKVGLEKHLFEKGFLNLSLEKNFVNDLILAEIGFRYDFSFAQAGASVRQSDNKTSFVQYARGSLIYDNKTNYLGTDNRPNVGKGGISVIPYLDLNSNGKKDKGEPKAYGLNLHVNGGRIEKSERDSTIRILGLEPYTQCFIELDPNSFEDISWRLPVKTLNVTVDPNILKTVEIPVAIVGEASGVVTLEENGSKKGQGRMIISFMNLNKKPAGKTLTEDDGYFTYFGLVPGKYYVQVDTAQLRKLGMISEPDSIQFSIKEGIDGDVVSNLNFNLKKKSVEKTTLAPDIKKTPVARKDTSYMIIHEVTQELVTITEDSYAIQLGAFKVKANADALRSKLQKLLGRKVEIIVEDDFFKVRIDQIKEREEVDNIIDILRKNGITEIWLISLRAKKQQMVLVERQDTVRQITETPLTEPDETIGPDINFEFGAFRERANALELLKQLRKRYGNRIKMVFEDGFYKLRLKGESPMKKSVLEEMEKLGPELGKLRFNDLWLNLPVIPEESLTEVIERPVITVSRVDKIPEVPSVIFDKNLISLKQSKIIRPAQIPALSVSIRVGVFDKKSLAVKAQKKIASKLKLNAEIVEQWDQYTVIIRGFHTREETYKYYPELAAIGYPGVSLIEE